MKKQGWLFGANYDDIKTKVTLIICKHANEIISMETQTKSIMSQK